MKVGLLGSGGREHALAKALTRDTHRDSLFVYASHINPGIVPLAADIRVADLTDISSVAEYFYTWQVDFVVVGPEVPLMAGVVDTLRLRGIPSVGPTLAQARIEGDKTFMRRLLNDRVGWGSPAWRTVQNRQEAAEFIRQVGDVAVKPLGLTGGKGVQVMGDQLNSFEDTLEVIDTWIKKDGHVLLEERLIGEEFSRMVFAADGVIVPMPVAQDFKYAYNGDKGGMTGGMGSYTWVDGSLPFLEPEDLALADQLIESTLAALVAETTETYRGFLYGQFMATADGVRLVEFNARLGDPEAINMMALFQGDLALVLHQLGTGTLENRWVNFVPRASLCKYLVPDRYPGVIDDPVTFQLDIEKIHQAGFTTIYASILEEGGYCKTLGSRALAIVGLGDHPGEISARMEELLHTIEPSGLRHRSDVGASEVIQAKVDRMIRLRKPGKV